MNCRITFDNVKKFVIKITWDNGHKLYRIISWKYNKTCWVIFRSDQNLICQRKRPGFAPHRPLKCSWIHFIRSLHRSTVRQFYLMVSITICFTAKSLNPKNEIYTNYVMLNQSLKQLILFYKSQCTFTYSTWRVIIKKITSSLAIPALCKMK